MMKYQWAGVALLSIAGLGSKVWGNPASTDYVNRKISEMQATFSLALNEASIRLGSEINSLRKQPRKVGDIYQGGRIFFVDDTGEHGLIAALTDANKGEGISWQNGEAGEKITNAQASGVRAGAHNTRLIISQQTIDFQPGNFAALAASRFAVLADGKTPCTTRADNLLPCYGDWYLPSIYELDLMRIHLKPADNYATAVYWSSTEVSVTEAMAEDMNTGDQLMIDKASHEVLARAIRAF